MGDVERTERRRIDWLSLQQLEDKIIDKINGQEQQYHGRQHHQYREVRTKYVVVITMALILKTTL